MFAGAGVQVDSRARTRSSVREADGDKLSPISRVSPFSSCSVGESSGPSSVLYDPSLGIDVLAQLSSTSAPSSCKMVPGTSTVSSSVTTEGNLLGDRRDSGLSSSASILNLQHGRAFQADVLLKFSLRRFAQRIGEQSREQTSPGGIALREGIEF